MGFFDLFRPKWKHSDADVRAEAVKQLGTDDDKPLAEVLKHDPDARIRRLALKKIDDPQLLGEVAEADPDEALRRDAAEKAQSVLQSVANADGDEARSLNALERIKSQKAIAEVAKKAAFESVRKAALARLDDQKAVAEVARRSDDPHLRRQAVDRVADDNVLRDIAINDSSKEVALAAVEKIDDQQALENVVKKTRSKVVKALAKERLEKLKEASRPKGGVSPEKRRAQLALVVRAVEEAAASDDFAHAQKAFEIAKKELAELGVHKGEETFQKRYDRAHLKFQARSQERQAIERAQAVQAERKKKVEAEQAKRSAEDEARAVEDAKLKEIADAARKEENARRDVERARRAEEKAKRDAEKAERDKEKAAAREKKEAESHDNLKRVEEAAVRLESLLAEANPDKKVLESALKSTDDVVKSAGRLPREGGDAARERHQAARAKLVIILQELKETDDWKRWANVPKLEALCARMDALVTSASAEGADPKAAGAQLKELQAEWKTVGPAPKDKSEALWKRFKAAGDQVYEKVKPQKAAVSDEERAANLAKKEELVTRVETLAATPDESINFKETAETIKTLQEEWKGIGQVTTKELSDELWKKFRAACDKFFDRRKAHFGELDAERGENLKKQEALCVRAEQLAGQADDAINWKDTADQLKALQADWKQIGPAPKEQADAVWNRFRAACDNFFERRKKHFDEQDAARSENLKKKELLCEKVEAMKDAEDHELAIAEVKKLQAEWKTIGPAPKEQADPVWNRFRAACDVVFDRARNPEPAPAPAATTAAAPAPESSSKFENKLPLSGIAEKLQQAADGWADLADDLGGDDKKK
jgi:hypothetical protein